MSDTGRGAAGAVKEIALTVGAILGLLCVAAAILALAFDIKPLVFRSGSMAPAIDTGSLALARPVSATEIVVGDVISVDRADGVRITHRVDSIVGVNGNSVELALKGDANSTSDPDHYLTTEAERVFAHAPYAGYFVSWLSTPYAWGLGGLLSVSLISIAWHPTAREDTKPRQAAGRHSAGTHSAGKHTAVASIALVAVTATVIGVGASRSEMTLAALTDNAYARTTVTAATVDRPASFTCSGGGVASPPILSWPNANTSYGYTLLASPGSVAPIVFSPSSAATLSYDTGLIARLLGLGTFTFTLRSTVGNFVSVGSRTFTVQFATSVLTSCGTGSANPAGVAARGAPLQATPPPATAATDVASPTTTEAEPTTVTAPAPEVTPSATTPVPPTTTTTTVPPTTTVAPTTTVPPTTTPPAPVDLVTPKTSPSGASAAKVVSVDGSPTLQIVGSDGAVQYAGPITSSDTYGYGVQWASTDQLWLLGPAQLVRFDNVDGSWSRSVVDPSAKEGIPAEIAALVN